MRTAEFRSTVDVGQTRIGTVTCRAMWHQGSEWATFVNLADDPALDAGGLEADDFLAQFLAEPGMADAYAAAVAQANAAFTGSSRALFDLLLRQSSFAPDARRVLCRRLPWPRAWACR